MAMQRGLQQPTPARPPRLEKPKVPMHTNIGLLAGLVLTLAAVLGLLAYYVF